MRSADRDSQELSREDVGRRGAPADVGRARRAHRSVDALRPPEAKLDHRLALRRQADARGLGRDQRLEVDQVEERRLQQHAGNDRAADAQERLLGKYRGAFGDGVHVDT